ncbi:hypothetical protein KKA96_00600, partial [Patescibacteria group bacterium]|nr:hypothetical protein [Patescibacteria group bacterium]
VCIASSYDSANPPVASILSTSFCQNLCSVKDYANDTKYHCMKADLRVGATAHPTSKDITIKAGDKVYFDARTYSADYNYSSLNLKGDSYTLPPSFDNGIDRYEIDFSTPIIGLPVADYGASEGTSCSFLWGALGAINNFWGVAGVTDTTKGDLIPLYPYSSTGKYEVKLNIQSKNGCYETIDKAYVNVNP